MTITDTRTWYEELFHSGDYYRFWVGSENRPIITEERTRREVDLVRAALPLATSSRILDLCCGHGRHSIPLARAGYVVAGLDFSRRDLDIARGAADENGLDIDWIEADMREIPAAYDGQLDAVINMFTAFGYFDEEAENQRVLDSVGRALRPGGRFLIELPNLSSRMRLFRDRDWEEHGDTLMLLSWFYDASTGRMNDELRIIEADGTRRSQRWSVRLYTYVELTSMLQKAGLSPIEVWGDTDRTEFNFESRRMIVLAEKNYAP